MPQELFKEFAQLDQVEAIVLGGSRAGQHFDKDSDYDVYVYLTDSIAPMTRRNILSKYCSYMEIGNQFWELEDDCVLKSDIEIELIYRTLDSFDKDLQTVSPRPPSSECLYHLYVAQSTPQQNHLRPKWSLRGTSEQVQTTLSS